MKKPPPPFAADRKPDCLMNVFRRTQLIPLVICVFSIFCRIPLLHSKLQLLYELVLCFSYGFLWPSCSWPGGKEVFGCPRGAINSLSPFPSDSCVSLLLQGRRQKKKKTAEEIAPPSLLPGPGSLILRLPTWNGFHQMLHFQSFSL